MTLSSEPLGNPQPAQFTLRSLLVLIAVAAMLLGIAIPAIRAANERTHLAQCSNNMKQCVLAVHNYLDVYRCFPPAYTVDIRGVPINSWRVLVAPFIESGNIVAGYRYEEPWDSAANRRYTTARIYTYRCPSAPETARNETNYVMIVGPDMFAEGSSPTQLETIKDGTSNTILAVEAIGGKIPWACPRDLQADKMTFEVNDLKTLGISSHHWGGAHGVYCDGAVFFLSNSRPASDIRALCTRSGGEKVER